MATTPLLLDQFTSALRNLMAPPENNGFSPLTLAAREGCVDIVQELMVYGDNSFVHAISGSSGSSSSCTPLEAAIKSNKWEVIRALAELGVDMNSFQPDININTAGEDYPPVHLAVREGHNDSLKTLLECGADASALNKMGYSPLHIAAQEGNMEAIRALVDVGVGVNIKSHTEDVTPMHQAAAMNQLGAVRTLVELGGDVSALDHRGRTPLHTAAHQGQVAAVTTLIELHANINEGAKNGDTPMHLAVEQEHVETIKALARLNSHVNHWNYNGDAPLHVAARENKVASIRALAEVGADFNVDGNSGWTPLHIAVEFSHEETIRALIEFWADIDDTRGYSLSPLDIAVDYDREMASTVLVNCGADVTSCVEEYNHGSASVHPDKKENFDHIYEMMHKFFDRSNIPNFPCELAEVNNGLFTLTKLMMYSTTCTGDSSNNSTCSNSTCNSGAYAPKSDREDEAFEAAIGSAVHSFSSLWRVTPQALAPTAYILKSRLTRAAWRVCSDSMLIDGDRIDITVRAKRYVEIVCCMFNRTMLLKLVSLRMTCKSCSERRRFPVCVHGGEVYHELEVNLIESFIAYDASRFIPTGVIFAALGIHDRSKAYNSLFSSS